ncbi:potassium voltage-gated channel subfamily C member 1-like [Mytilus californianus]|uniref:potassium voltage-gated channel subfamily C member 1-like n=1 Tax=Mytilus californianus TaxID=6549 RepID=UPI0022479CE6|nr:potassium voltage-gated channel subfamily C member 1-like [Mytilus californianus]
MIATHPDVRQKVVDIDILIYWVNLNRLNLWIDKGNPKEVIFVPCSRTKEFFKDWLNVLDEVLFIAMWTIFVIDKLFTEKLLENITFLICVLLFANLIYFAELRDPTTSSDMVIGLWWSVVTMTTVGYGDEVPKSALGRIFASLCAVSGLLLLAMPIAVIAGKLYD